MGLAPDLHLRRTGASHFGSYFPIRALRAGQHEPRVWHVVAQVHVRPAAQDPASLLQRDVRFYGNGIGADDRPAGTSLTLDFSAFGVSARATTDSPPTGGGAGTSRPPRGTLRVTEDAGPYLVSHLAKELLESLPQLPYGSPAELTLSKQIPGAGLAPRTSARQHGHRLPVALVFANGTGLWVPSREKCSVPRGLPPGVPADCRQELSGAAQPPLLAQRLAKHAFPSSGDKARLGVWTQHGHKAGGWFSFSTSHMVPVGKCKL